MSLGSQRIVYGVHSVSPRSRGSKIPYGILKVIGSASIALSAPINELNAGAQRFSWAAEPGFFKSEMSLKVKAYPGFLFTQFLGASVTENAAEATGSVSALTNALGVSVMDAVTGVASVGIVSGSEGSVKFAKYVIVAQDATHVDVYAMSDVDGSRGTPFTYQDDSLKINSAPLIVTTAGVMTPIPGTGLQLVGGSGTIALVPGDSAIVESRPINSKSIDIKVGSSTTNLPAFNAILLAQKRATAEMFEIEAYNCVASGFPIPLDEMKFSETELKMSLLYDADEDGVFRIRSVNPLS